MRVAHPHTVVMLPTRKNEKPKKKIQKKTLTQKLLPLPSSWSSSSLSSSLLPDPPPPHRLSPPTRRYRRAGCHRRRILAGDGYRRQIRVGGSCLRRIRAWAGRSPPCARHRARRSRLPATKPAAPACRCRSRRRQRGRSRRRRRRWRWRWQCGLQDASSTQPRGASLAEVRRILSGGEESVEKMEGGGGEEKGNLIFFLNRFIGNEYFSVRLY